jgi:hypothetical protein
MVLNRFLVTHSSISIFILGCAHFQQLIWQVFNSVEKGFAAAEDTDTSFLEGVLFVMCSLFGFRFDHLL